MLVYPHDGAWHLPLTLRGSTLRHHTGQVSLPGGRVDEGETFETAALRETFEEVGVDPGAVDVLGRLTPLHIPVSGHLLHPVVGVDGGAADVRPGRRGGGAAHRGAARRAARARTRSRGSARERSPRRC